MANDFGRFFNHKHYTYHELLRQILSVVANYSHVNYRIRKGRLVGVICLQPTEESVQYKLKISAKVGSTVVEIFPMEPYIGRVVNGKTVPHMYSNGSLCLYYPDYGEWKYTDLWADTLIPWTSLWLFYYELWLQTGEWLGGGVHSGKN